MSVELPDWLRGTLLLGRDGAGNIIPILIDAAGQINVLLRGVDALGTTRTVRVDNVGQLYAILRGAGGNDVAVDAAGNLAAILKGIDGLGNLRTLLVDASGQAIMVPRGASGNYLDVDASGYLSAILKGWYAGAYHTISVDANGRIDAFLMDGADQWGQTLRIGNAELASRQGSPAVYDWRGNTLHTQTFEHGEGNLYNSLSGLGASVTVDPTYSLMGGYSLKMLGGSNLAMYAIAQGIIGTNPSDRIGLTVCWSEMGLYDKVVFSMLVRKAATRYHIRMYYKPGTGVFGYINNTGAEVVLGTLWLTNQPWAFNFAKIVADVGTAKYVRAMVNTASYDISAAGLFSDGIGSTQAIEVEITVTSTGGNNFGIYLDRYIVTVNEP